MLAVLKTLNQSIHEPHLAPPVFLAHHLVSRPNRGQCHMDPEAPHQKKA